MNSLSNIEFLEAKKNVFEVVPWKYHCLLQEIERIFWAKNFEKFCNFHLENIDIDQPEILLWSMIKNMAQFPDIIINQFYINVSRYFFSENKLLNIEKIEADTNSFFKFSSQNYNLETPNYIRENLSIKEEKFFELTGIKFSKIMKYTIFFVSKIFEDRKILKEYDWVLRWFSKRWIFEYFFNYFLNQSLYQNWNFDESKSQNFLLSATGQHINSSWNQFDFFQWNFVFFLNQKEMEKSWGKNSEGHSIKSITFVPEKSENKIETNIILFHEFIHKKNNHLASYLASKLESPNQILERIMDEIVAWMHSGQLEYEYDKLYSNEENKPTLFKFFRSDIIKQYLSQYTKRLHIPKYSQQNDLEYIGYESIDAGAKSWIDLAFDMKKYFWNDIAWTNILIFISPKNWSKLHLLIENIKNLK